MTDIILLRKATNDDCRDIWLWRNHPEVRKRFFDTEPIPWRKHKRWFDLKVKDPDTKIYIAMVGEDKAGIVRFDIEKEGARISANLNPDFFGKGLGSKMMGLGVEKLREETKTRIRITGELKKENIVSIKALTKIGFKFKEGSEGRYEVWKD